MDVPERLAPDSTEFRLELGKLLKQSRAVSLVMSAIAEHKGPIALSDLADALRLRPLDSWSDSERLALAETVISLLCWARSGTSTAPRPLFNIRVQAWLREMARIVAKAPRSDEMGSICPATLHHADDLDSEELQQSLPVINCQRCGTSAFLGRQSLGSTSLNAPLDTLYKEFFEDNSSADKLRLIYTNKLQDRQTKAAGRVVYPGLLEPEALAFHIDDKQLDRSDGKIPAWLYTASSIRAHGPDMSRLRPRARLIVIWSPICALDRRHQLNAVYIDSK